MFAFQLRICALNVYESFLLSKLSI